MLWFLVTGDRAVEATIAHCQPRSRLRPLPTPFQQLAIDRTSITCLLLCSAVFGFWTVDLTHSLSSTAVAFFLLAPLSIYLLGRRTLRWIDLPTALGHAFPLEFLAGSFVAGFFLFFLDFVSPLPMRGNCIAVLVVSILVQLVPSRAAPAVGSRQAKFFSVLAVIVSLTAATFWTRDLRPYAIQVGNEVIFRPWWDYFVHAQMVGQVRADHSLLQLGNPDLAGLPLPFYHYASYIFPASVSAFTGQTAYDSLASFWTPFGILLTGLAAYVLGSCWWSSRAGLAALIGVLLVPDASTYGFRDAYFSYHWLVAICPGLLYGIAAAALGLLIVSYGVRPTRWRRLGAGFGLVVMCIPLKAHLFIVVCPLLVTWVVLFKEGWTGRKRLFVGLALMTAGLAALIVADRFHIGPTIIPFGPDRSTETYLQRISAPLSDPVHSMMHVVLSRIGIPALILPALALFCYYRKTLQPIDALPALALLILLAGTIFLPLNHGIGTQDELQHRPFVWAYFVVAVWTWGKIVSILETSPAQRRAVISGVLIVASIVLLAWPWTRGETIQDPRLPWSTRMTDVRVAFGLTECARFLREHTAEEDIVQEAVTLDFPLLGGLAERRCYLARIPTGWDHYDPNVSLMNERKKRAEVVPQIRAATTRSELLDLANQTHIRWYVAHADEKLGWPEEIRARPAFQSDGYRVYDLTAK